jgi:hypothetical protein
VTTLSHKFVECIPDTLEEGVLYVSITHSTAVHRCCCGCGCEVVTPITPIDWKLIFDGETVSLYPSIGSWNLPCRSHYWITHNRIEWAEDWSDWKVAVAEEKDRSLKEKLYRDLEDDDSVASKEDGGKARAGLWARFWKGW